MINASKGLEAKVHVLSEREPMRAVIIVIGILFSMQAVAQEPVGDLVSGQKIAKRRCAQCHDVSGKPEPQSPPGNAPPFISLAKEERQTHAKIRTLLRLPHGRMVDLMVTGRQADDLAAYIMSLR
jgi:mono/diheme cytochrome c family protein